MTGSGGLRRLLHPLYRGLETRAQLLRYLFVEITQRCNLACLHCGSDCTRDAQRGELSCEEWCAFFDYLGRSFDRKQLVLVVTGGEPFCALRFPEIIEGIARNELAWGMVSNGWSLSPANVRQVVRQGLQSMTVSLDGLEASHDWLRGRPGSFRRAVEGIRSVVAADLPFFDVVTCVNPRNLAELDGVLALLRGLGVTAWRLFMIFPKGRARANPALHLSDAETRQLFDWIATRRRELESSGFDLNFSCEGYLPPGLDRAVRDEPYFCRAGIAIGSVLCDGAISACPNISRSLVQGNIRVDDFKTVWENGFAPFRERSWMKQGRCEGCAEWRRCQGNSMHLWDDEAGGTAFCHRAVLGG